MQSQIIEPEADVAASDNSATESPEAAARRQHNEQVLATLEAPLLELEKAFAGFDRAKLEEQQLVAELEKARVAEAEILKNETLSERAGVKALLEARALKDLHASRCAAAAERTNEERDLVLELGIITRKCLSDATNQLLAAREE